MNRRAFLERTLVAGAALAGGRLAGEEPAVPAPARRLVLGAPLTHSDWILKPGVAWGVAGVRHMLDQCKACGWTQVYWRVLDGGRALYRSKLMRPQGKWDEDNFWQPQSAEDRALLERFTPGMSAERRAELLNKFQGLDYSQFDSLAAAVSYGREIGLEIHAWISINEDDHGWGLQSEFSKRHPGCRWRKRNGKMYHSQLSFAFREVQRYKLGLLKEILRYDIAGIFLDWIRTGDVRDNPQTDADGVADSGYEEPLVRRFQKKYDTDPQQLPNGDERWVRLRAEPQTEFMRAARDLVRGDRRRLPMAALVGHPWHYRGEQNKIDGNLRGLLLDVKAWARDDLVDSVVAAGYYRDGGNAELAWRALREETEGKVNVWTYAWVPVSSADALQTFALADKLGANHVLFWEADYIDDRLEAAEIKTTLRRRATPPKSLKTK
jgi:uncharacterized lipoprotein YddW (UPF0748 family)